MNYIKLITAFFKKAADDQRITPSHFCLYLSIFRVWNTNRFENPIQVSRSELMKFNKIKSKATYHKCMKELQEYGYLKYCPSYHPNKGSEINLFGFCTGEAELIHTSTNIEQVEAFNPFNNQTTKIYTGSKCEPSQFKICTATSSINEPFINYLNYKHINKQEKKSVIQKMNGQIFPPQEEKEREGKEKLRQKKSTNASIAPTIEEVKNYFTANQLSISEAEKFFHYNQSKGWSVGNNKNLTDWKPLAALWVINAGSNVKKEKQARKSLKNHHIENDKNYDEPF
jgi:hypothetical protein